MGGMEHKFTFNERDRVVLTDDVGTWRGEVTARRFVGEHEVTVVKWDSGMTEHLAASELILEADHVG